MTLYRWDVINALLETTKQKRFLEIGVHSGVCGARIRASEKWGVDPQPKPQASRHYHRLDAVSSDAFFAALPAGQTFDVVLIDGLHHADQVQRDIDNALRHLDTHGVVILHDCNPQNELAQRIPRQVGVWNGDCWKAMARLRQRVDMDAFTIDSDHGIGVVRKRTNAAPLTDLPADLSYEALDQDRERLLGLVSADRWQERYGVPLSLGRVAIASAIFGGRDVPKPAPQHDIDEYVLFTDGPGATGWTVERSPRSDDPRRRAREIKARLLELVDADVVVWVDGRVRPTGAALKPLLRSALSSADVASYPHPWRSCAYDEATECARLGLAPAGSLEAQAAAYRAAGLPSGAGLWNTMVLARRRTQATIDLGSSWRLELSTHSLRDQVSFPFVLWKHRMQCVAMGRDVYREGSSQHFVRGAHSGGTRE